MSDLPAESPLVLAFSDFGIVPHSEVDVALVLAVFVEALAGGCLEQDIREQSAAIYTARTMKTLVYDLSSEDDLGWGKGAGCNGEITVLLQDIDSSLRQMFFEISSSLQKRKPVLYVQSLLDYDDFQLYTADQPSIFLDLFNCPYSHVNGIKTIK